MTETRSNVIPMADAKPATFEIKAVVDGFPVNIRVEGKADALRSMIDRLKAIGAQPPAAAVADSTSAPAAKPDAPTCPVHGSKMRPSRKPGGWFCAKRDDSGDFCDHKV